MKSSGSTSTNSSTNSLEARPESDPHRSSNPQQPPPPASDTTTTLSTHDYHLRQAQQAGQSRSLERVSFDRTDNAPASTNLPLRRYPIRARRLDDDPLLAGVATIDSDLHPTLLSMLQYPLPKGPENIGAPNCRSVKGTGGTMVEVIPSHRLHSTSDPLEYTMSTPNYTPPRQVIQSPAVLGAPDGNVHSPDDIRRPIQQSVQPPPPPPPTSAPPKSKKKGPVEFKTNFQFVVNEDAKTARNTVRQHVMREFRRRERWEQGRNKVSKAKKPSKGNPKAAAQVDFHPPAPTSPSDQGVLPDTTLTTSFGSDTPFRRDSDATSEDDQSQFKSMSISGQSDSTDSEADKFTAMLMQSEQPKPSSPPHHTPFTPYLEQGLFVEPKDTEEAVEELESTQYLPYQQDPWAEIARASINPFSTQIGPGAGAASKALLHHYAWVMPSLMDEIVTGTVFHRIGWLYSAVAVHDPTPYHTIVGYTLGHIAMLRGLDEPTMAMEHKEKSLQLINRRLSDSQEAASDGTIGAIANIASYELIDCNPDRFAMHMQGLARLVTQRGGIMAFETNPSLQTVLIRLDVIRAYMTISQPRFPTWASLRNLTPLAIGIGPGMTDWYYPPVGHDVHQHLFCEDAIRLIHGIEDVLMLMRSQSPFIPFTPDPSFRALLVDSLLHHMRRTLFNVPSGFDNNICRRVVRLAAIVLVDLAAAEFFQPYSPPSPPASSHSTDGQSRSDKPRHRNHPKGNQNRDQPERSPGSIQAPKDKKGLGLERLRERFPSIERNRHSWGRSIEMIVAVLMQAERMALERPFRAWYVADIVTLTMGLGIEEWAAVERALMADIVKRTTEERMERQARAQMQSSRAYAQGQETDVRYGYDPLPVWDVTETVRRFWNEWNGKVTP